MVASSTIAASAALLGPVMKSSVRRGNLVPRRKAESGASRLSNPPLHAPGADAAQVVAGRQERPARVERDRVDSSAPGIMPDRESSVWQVPEVDAAVRIAGRYQCPGRVEGHR